MKSTALFLLGLLIISAQAGFLKKQDDIDSEMDYNGDDELVLSQIDNHNFGSMILSTVSIHMSTESPAEDILNLLNGVQGGLEKDQAAADKKNATDQANCDNLISTYLKNIQYHTSTLATLKQVKQSNENLLAKDTAALSQTNSDIALNEKRTAEGTHTRATQAAEYALRVKEHDEAVSAIDAAVALVKNLKSNLFIELKPHFDEITVLLEKHRNSHPLYGPIIQTLSQLSTNADQDTVKKILDLFAKLRAALVSSKTGENALESQRIADWTKLLGDLQNEHGKLITKKKELESNIANYKKIIAETTKSIESHSAELVINQDKLAKTRKECTELSAVYVSQRSERLREIKIVKQIIAHLKEKYSQTKQYLKERVDKL